MKKLLSLAVFALAALPLAFSQQIPITVRAIVPIDFGGTLATDVSGGGDTDSDAKLGFGAGAEVMVTVLEGLQVGGGAQYLFNRGIDETGVDGKFGFIPVYGLAAYSFDLGAVKPYVIGRFGYNFHVGNDDYKADGDLKGGICFTVGGGVSYAIPDSPLGAFAEAGYAVNKGSIDGAAFDADISYKRIQACVGVSYSF